jgi:hypothetical protein
MLRARKHPPGPPLHLANTSTTFLLCGEVGGQGLRLVDNRS